MRNAHQDGRRRGAQPPFSDSLLSRAGLHACADPGGSVGVRLAVPRWSGSRRRLLAALVLLGGLVALAGWSADAWRLVAALLAATALGGLLCLQLRRIEDGEDRLHTLYRDSPIATAITRATDGVFLEANQAFLEMTGFARDEVIGRSSVGIGLWPDPGGRAAGISQLLEQRTLLHREAPFRRRSGELAHALFSAQVIELDGKPHVLLMMQDITALERASRRLRLATESASAGIWDWDAAQDRLEWDDGMYRLYGVTRQRYPDPREAWAAVAHPDDRQQVEQRRSAAIASGESYGIEFRIIRPDGYVRHIKSFGKVQTGAEGKTARVTGFNIEITERVRAEEAVRASEAFLQALVNQTDDLILSVDPELRITQFNEALRRMARVHGPADLKLGDDVRSITPRERHDELVGYLRRALHGQRLRADSVTRRRDGSVLHLDESYTPIERPDGTISGVSIIARDVSERRRTEQTIQAIVKVTGGAVGEAFFRSLVTELAAALNSRYALVGELVAAPTPHIRTVAVCGDGGILANFDYDLTHTPCAGVVEGGLRFFPSGLRRTFPENAMLRDLGLDSYLGIPLVAGSGQVLGLIAVLHDRPMHDSGLARTLLGIFATRAVAELERVRLEAERERAEQDLRASEERYRRLLETTNVVPWTSDPSEQRFTYIGPQIEKLLGFSCQQWLERGFWRSRLHPDDLEPTLEACVVGLESGEDHVLKYRFLAADGRVAWLRELVNVVTGQDGDKTLQGFLTDITEEKRAEEQLKLAGHVFESSGEAIMITDAQWRILSVNPAYSAITGYALDDVRGRTPEEITPDLRSLEGERAIWDEVERSGFWQGELWDRRRNGETYPKWVTVSAVRGEQGQVVNFIKIFSDISERKEREERVRHLAHHDFLTDLPNRVLLADRIARAISMAHRTASQVAILFLDLDRFKNVNDSLGHSIGDKLLQEVARRLRACIRASDTVSRLGGDEFVLLVPEVTDAGSVAVLAQKVLDSVARPYTIEGHELISSPSIGITVFPTDGEDVETLLRNADAAMYHAKDSGRNNYQFFTPDMNIRATERLSMERSLRRALERGELRLHYQPQYEVASGRIVGMEALIRWEHPEHGLVSPARFMPFAEESGLILPIGEWVLQEACRQNRAWQDAGLKAVRVAVNISALQFRQPGFADTVRAALERSGLPARYLELEVTESVIMHDAERVTASLEALKQMGLELAIDDFGTGYSSLSYLKRFPIDRLKIDQSFVRDITSDRDDAAITSAIIALTRNLGLKTIAEGVETREQLEFLRTQGCNEVQGYLLSRPVEAGACAALLAAETPIGGRQAA
jgi:diguanylate cyclase (GGDEF)-like protein/PAS domain S-box-containing protein